MPKKVISAVKTVILPLLVGLLAGLIIENHVDLFGVFIKPPFTPSAGFFSVAWMILYLFMGISFLLFQLSIPEEKDYYDGTLFYYIQLLLNFLWPILFFNGACYLGAFCLLIGLFVFALFTAAIFFKNTKTAGFLFLPYLLFLLYAGYLNFAIYFINM